MVTVALVGVPRGLSETGTKDSATVELSLQSMVFASDGQKLAEYIQENGWPDAVKLVLVYVDGESDVDAADLSLWRELYDRIESEA